MKYPARRSKEIQMAKEKVIKLEELSEEVQIAKLKALVPSYFVNNQTLNSLKKVTDEENKSIKSIMMNLNLDSYTVDGKTANISKVVKTSLDEEALLAWLKENELEANILKTREYVDMEALENAIYHGVINPVDLAKFQVDSTQIKLTLNAK